MAELRTIVRAQMERGGSPTSSFNDLVRRRDRKRRNQRIGAAGVALFVIAAIFGAAIAVMRNGERPARPTPTPSNASPSKTREVVIVGLDGTTLGTVPGMPSDAWTPSLSPDGRTIAFIDSRSRLGTIGIDGRGRRRLDLPVAAERPAWSPDSSEIAFEGTKAGNTDIYVVDANGTHLRRLTTSRWIDQWPAWAPDGGTIVYDNTGPNAIDPNGDTTTSRLYTVPVVGGTARLLAPLTGVSAPSWSPDGTKIAFKHAVHGLWIMDANGTHAHELLPWPRFSPRWSPDGTKIAFTRYDPTWRASLPGAVVIDGEQRSAGIPLPVLSLRYIDIRSGQVFAVKGVETASEVNTPQWMPFGNALLILRVLRE
jgi:Tol biopolymer transport system component